MATKKPLCIYGGELEELRAGDSLSSVSDSNLKTLTNEDVTNSLAIGDAVYISSADKVKPAQADADSTSKVIGLAREAIASGGSASGSIQTDGVIAGLTGLVAGADYYLSTSVIGGITNTAPTTAGQYVVKIGRALSTTELEITIEPRIKLS